MIFLPDIRIVDMRRSGVPPEEWKDLQSDRQLPEGWHEIRKYVPFDYKMDASIRPDYKFVWNRNEIKDIRDWQVKWRFSLVTVDDGYWPEGCVPNGENHYEHGDLILMKISISDFIEKRKVELKADLVQREGEARRFKSETKKLGAEVNDQILHDLIGI